MVKPKSILAQLKAVKGLEIECPECGEPFSSKKAQLFSIREPLPAKIQAFLIQRNSDMDDELKEIKDQRAQLRAYAIDKPTTIQVTTTSVNFGKVVEKIIPSFKEFPYEKRDCRALYEPIDYIIFNKLTISGIVDSIVFTDVKSGNAQLKDNQRQIKRLVEAGKVKMTVVDHG